jgi:hypothetical protein
LGSFEVGLCALQIRLRPLQLGMRAFEIGLHPRAFRRDRLFQFTPRLRRPQPLRLARPRFRARATRICSARSTSPRAAATSDCRRDPHACVTASSFDAQRCSASDSAR